MHLPVATAVLRLQPLIFWSFIHSKLHTLTTTAAVQQNRVLLIFWETRIVIRIPTARGVLSKNSLSFEFGGRPRLQHANPPFRNYCRFQCHVCAGKQPTLFVIIVLAHLTVLSGQGKSRIGPHSGYLNFIC